MKTTRLVSSCFIFIALVFLFSCNQAKKETIDLNDISTAKDIPQGHKAFIAMFYPAIVEANKSIMLDRANLINLRNDYTHVIVKKNKFNWINEMAAEYRFGENFFTEETTREEFKNKIDTLLFRVDYIPEKLVLAQAIIESGWGKSKFSTEINNYFGIHCYEPGCGMPASEVENPKFWVKSFPSIKSCIQEYVWNLNTGFAYENLRLKRLELREKKQYPNARLMAQGLLKYSEKGSEYVNLIETIIKNYLPANLEEYVNYIKMGEPALS